MNITHNIRPRNIWWIAILFLVILLASQCDSAPEDTPTVEVPTPVVSDLTMSHPSRELLPGEEVKIWASIKVGNREIPVVCTWSTEGGEITRGQEPAKITYKAPDTPGTYGVNLKVECGDWDTERSMSIVVVSPTPTPSPTPTNTPTSTDTPMPTPTATSTPTPIPDAVVNTEALNLRSGPGVVYDKLGLLEQDDPLEIAGRNEAGNWVKVVCPGGKEGWVAASCLEINIPLAGVAVAQASPTPTPMYTPTLAVTPTPTLLPPPIPLAPANGECFIGGNITFRWQWNRPLAPDEFFSLRVYREGETEPCHHDKTEDLKYSGHLSYCSAGWHYWRVALVRGPFCTDCPEEERWQKVSEPSVEQSIYYTPGEEPWVRPQPPDDDKEKDNDKDKGKSK